MFNETYYLRMNPDVAAAVEQGRFTAQQHFELYGKFENRSPSPFFDPVMYLQANPDVAAAAQIGLINPFDHFMTYGQNEGRSPSLFFNEAVYLASSPDVAAAVDAGMFSSPFEHFLLHGQNEARNISPFFDLAGYLDANPDVADAVREGATTAFDHFINYGFGEGRDLGNGVSLARFANDPQALEAIEAGDVTALMGRVAEIAPFLPTFTPPEGYEIPADTPIPTDFVPVGEEKLVIPPGVEAPDELPPYFEDQPDPDPEPEPDPEYDVVNLSNVPLDEVALQPDGTMWVGSSNPGSNFQVTRIDHDQDGEYDLEIALGGQGRFGPEIYVPEADGTINVPAGNDPVFKFSVASLNEDVDLEALLATYDIRLQVDTLASAETNFITLLAEADSNDSSGALDWAFLPSPLFTPDYKLSDDQGTDLVSQNIQRLSWYQPQDRELFQGGAVQGGAYTVRLEVLEKGTVNVVGASEVVFNVPTADVV